MIFLVGSIEPGVKESRNIRTTDKTLKVFTIASSMTTNSSTLDLPSASHSLTTVDISLTSLPSSSCTPKNQDSRKSSKYLTGDRSASNVNSNESENKPQDGRSPTTAVEMAQNPSQLILNQSNRIHLDECFGPKHFVNSNYLYHAPDTAPKEEPFSVFSFDGVFSHGRG